MTSTADAPIPVLYLNPHGERAGAERLLDALIRGHRAQQPMRFDPQVVCGGDGLFSQELRQDGVPVTIHRLRLRHLAGSVAWLRGFLRERGIRLIHTTMAHYHVFAWLATRGLDVKCLWFNHGPCSRRWWKGWQHVLPADATVVMCRFMADCHRGFSLAPAPRLIHYGLEDKWFIPRPELRARTRVEWGISDEEIAVGNLGRIEDWKRQHCFLDAVADLPAAVAGRCRFFIGGAPCLGRGHDYFAELQKRRDAHPYRERVQLLGQVQAEAFWEAMDVAVHCAHDEPFGMVVLEAMAKRKLVIAAPSGGVPEMISHGVNGFLEDPANRAALTARLADVVSRHAQLTGLRDAAHRTAADKFTTARLIRDFETLYEELLGLPRQPRNDTSLQRSLTSA